MRQARADDGDDATDTATDHGSRAARGATSRSVPVRSGRSARTSTTAEPASGETTPVPRRTRASRTAKATPTHVVAVTGAARGVGRSLVERLVRRADVTSVVAVDEQRVDVTGAGWRAADVRSPELVDALAGCTTVVHAVVPDVPGEPSANGARPDVEAALLQLVEGARTVVTAAAAANVPRVVLVTSAMVYGAAADNPVPLDEDMPAGAVADGPAITALLDVEEIAAQARRVHPGLRVTVVRPAILVGPGADSVLTRHFEAPRLLVVKDSRPHWQFCHVDDLVSALELAAVGTVEGAVSVASDGFLTQDEVEEVTGLRRIELPSRIAYGTAERLHRLGMTPAPSSELAFTAEPWVVPSTRLRAAGWAPTHDNRAALAALMEERTRRPASGRRLGRDATLGAAGATVAVLGTAAVVRQIRRQRRGG
jgi:nucleoside-diphosphate-sugar epimerase